MKSGNEAVPLKITINNNQNNIPPVTINAPRGGSLSIIAGQLGLDAVEIVAQPNVIPNEAPLLQREHAYGYIAGQLGLNVAQATRELAEPFAPPPTPNLSPSIESNSNNMYHKDDF